MIPDLIPLSYRKSKGEIIYGAGAKASTSTRYGVESTTLKTNVHLGPAEAWTVEEIRGLVMYIAKTIVADQEAKANPPVEVRVDGVATKSIMQLNSRLDIVFGALDARPLMQTLMGLVTKMGFDGVSWVWIGTGRQKEALDKQIKSGGPVLMLYGQRLLLVPRGPGEGTLTFQNILDKHGFAFDESGRRLKRYRNSVKKIGLIGSASRAANRVAYPYFRVWARPSEKRNPSVGRMTGKMPWKSAVQPPAPAYYQGVWFYSIGRSWKGNLSKRARIT